MFHESAGRSNCATKLRRAMSAVTYAKTRMLVWADAAFALQSPRPDEILFCLAAIAVAQSGPLVKVAMLCTGIDGQARVASAPASMGTQELPCFVRLKKSPAFLAQLIGLYCETGKNFDKLAPECHI